MRLDEERMKKVEEFIYRITLNSITMTVDVEKVGELIRCKDCKHRSTTHFCSDEQEWCDFWRPLFGESHSTDLNKHCAWAERKEE